MHVDPKSCPEDFDGCEFGCITESYPIGYTEKPVRLPNGTKPLDVVLASSKHGEWSRTMSTNDITTIYFTYSYGTRSDSEDENGNPTACKYITDAFFGIKCSHRAIVDVSGCRVHYRYPSHYTETGTPCEAWAEERRERRETRRLHSPRLLARPFYSPSPWWVLLS